MKIGWKLFVAFYMPLHFAFGCFYLSNLMQNKSIEMKSGFSYEFSHSFSYDDPHLFAVLSGIFLTAGIGLIILSVSLPLLILYRKNQTPFPKLLD